MELLTQFALAAGLAWASGIRVYLVAFVLGMAHRQGLVVLPGDLSLLSHDIVLWASGVMLVGEFVADKVAWFDSLWDAAHTFIRLPGGMLLAFWALGDQGPAAQMAAALIGGTIVSGTHLMKAGSRVAINHSPEPFSNIGASLGEDVAVIGGLWLLYEHPLVFMALLAVFMALVIWLAPKLWRLVRGVWRFAAGRLSGHQAEPG